MRKAIRMSDVSALPRGDREVIARFDAALLGVPPAPGSDEAAVVAAMNRFVNELRGAQVCASAPDAHVQIDDVAKKATAKAVETPVTDPSAATARHWFYPSAVIGCGLRIDDLCTVELACLHSEVTCPSCLAQLQVDRTICEACRLGSPESVSAHLAPPHVCDPARS